MIYFLYGEDTFSSKLKLNAIKRKFLDKHGIDNLVIRRGYELADTNLGNVFFAQTLLGGKRLVVLEDILSGADDVTQDALVSMLGSSLPEDVTVIVHESQSFDRRRKLFKQLNRPGCAQEFTLLSPAALTKRITELASEKRVNIAPALIRHLISRAGTDLWTINNELDKLAALALARAISRQDIDTLVSADVEVNVFELLDRLAGQDLKSAHNILQTALNRGEDEIKFMGAVAYQLRNLIRVLDLQAQGLPPAAIIKKTSLPPFTVRRSLDQIKQVSRSRLVSMYQQLVATDHQIKTGASRPADALDLMVAKQA